jgi:hypothetical protein
MISSMIVMEWLARKQPGYFVAGTSLDAMTPTKDECMLYLLVVEYQGVRAC